MVLNWVFMMIDRGFIPINHHLVVLQHWLGFMITIIIITTLIPSGKLTKNYGKSPFLMGKLTINGHFQ